MRNEIENLLPQELVAVARISQALLIVLNARLFTLLGMALSASLFGWVMWQPDWIRFAGACAFAVIVYLPVQRLEHNRNKAQEQANE